MQYFPSGMRPGLPVFWSAAERSFVVSGYREVSACLGLDSLSSRVTTGSLANIGPAADIYTGVLHRQLDLMDPPRHTALRKLFAHAFSPARMDHLQSFAEGWVTRKLASLGNTFDVMSEISDPLPLVVVSELLGGPDWLRSPLERAVTTFVSALEEPIAQHVQASNAIRSVESLLAEAIREPTLAEFGLLAQLRDAIPSVACFEELVANIVLIVAAGHHTTRNVIGNGALLLLTHPEQRSIVSARPGAWETAVEEILRFESPVQSVRRVATTPVALAGRAIARGDELTLLLGAANRDPEVFSNADQFSVARTGNYHLAFGFGLHHCLGAQLARRQAHAALAALFTSTSLRAVESEPRWIPSSVYRGLQRLIVERS